MKKLSLSMVMFLIITLVLSSACFAASSKVIGVATIKKGTVLTIMMMLPQGPAMGEVSAFEDQEVYIEMKIEPSPSKKHRGGYALLSSGFVNNCQLHGREVLDDFGAILLPIEDVESGVVSVKLFKE